MQDNPTTLRTAKRFSIEEANAMLPLVRSIASDIGEVFRSVTSRRSDLHRLLRKGSRTAGSVYEAEMAESRADLQEEYDRIWHYREELESLGVYLRHPEDGLIEFPSTLDGREVYLCWQLGEEQIRYWREADPASSPKQLLPEFEDAH